ncbi:Erythrocyte band 7 integral membrane protein [Fasciolopsis buskii]|uniref:Erythrocyte band 7 integral membrane protein n=1 Tax=Fasciolopsis buskii TaxID=27845 RepID=A0A8E0RMI1_9TREM|nr:Erythrocyte band 7 integral membrane protein [Fasciolopsis buski]
MIISLPVTSSHPATRRLFSIRSQIIAATGEQEAARSLKKAARVIATSPMAFQLRYLQTLCAISAEKNSTIFFPVPIDIMQNLGDFGYSSNQTLRNVKGWMRTQIEPTALTVTGQSDVTNARSAKLTRPIKSGDNVTEHLITSTNSPKDNAFWPPDDTDENSDTV